MLLVCAQAWTASADALPKIALIIDDVGYNYRRDVAMTGLGVPVTMSILPDFNQSLKVAEYSHNLGLEVMLHLSMESVSGANMGKIGLAQAMGDGEKIKMLDLALSQVPYAVGLNNHMGSLLTADSGAMAWLMTELAKRKLYFIDSLTTQTSVAGEKAQQQGVAWAERQVFLDNSLLAKDLDYQFQLALVMAKRDGAAIVIAHPHPETFAFLKRRLALAKEFDQVEFVFVSDLLKPPTITVVQR